MYQYFNPMQTALFSGNTLILVIFDGVQMYGLVYVLISMAIASIACFYLMYKSRRREKLLGQLEELESSYKWNVHRYRKIDK